MASRISILQVSRLVLCCFPDFSSMIFSGSLGQTLWQRSPRPSMHQSFSSFRKTCFEMVGWRPTSTGCSVSICYCCFYLPYCLGLGDIVIPGIFTALLYRFDHYIGHKKSGEPRKSRFYFYAVVIGYMLGLFVTMGIMHLYKSAQPALLYLVPACIIIPLFLALIRGEFKELWNYSEDHLVDPKGKDKEKQKAEKKGGGGDKKNN